MITNTYISSPGVVNTSPTDTTVYLLSSINAVGKELIIRDGAPLTSGRIVVSTTAGLYFSRALSTVQLSSFTITAPYDYITVASRTPQEYMLLQSVQLPTRTNNQAFTPNFLQLSTLTANSITTGSNAALGDLAITGSIETATGATTTLNIRTIQATNASTSQLTASTIQAAFTTAADYTTPTLHTLYSAYAANLSTPAAFAVTTDASFNASYLQYGDLKTLAPTTVAGTSFFGSTLTVTGDTRAYGPTVGFGSAVGVLGSVRAATTLSTLGTWSSDGPFYTSNYTATAHTSTTQTYRAGQTYIGTKLGVGTSNNTSYSAYIDGHTYVSADLTSPSISTNTYSTLGISLSSINFITPAQTARVRTDISYVYLNEVPIIGSEVTYSSTVTSSNWTSTSYLVTDTVSINRPYPYSAPNPTVAIDMQGGAYISTALVAGNLAIYGGPNANLYTNPTYNTIYLSSSGMLVNNRLFINKENNRVGINTTNPAYTLDVSGLIYHTSSIAYNTGSSTWIIPSDDTLKENVADISANPYTEIFENVKLKTYNYKETTYNVDVSEAVYDGAGNITGYTNAIRTYKRGFASDYGIANTTQYGFIAQDLEFYFPNSVYEKPFYGYEDFRFIDYDAITNVNYAMTGMMISTARYHSTLIGHRTDLLSTCTTTQTNMLLDLSGNVGYPYNKVTIGNGGVWSVPSVPITSSDLALIASPPALQLTWSVPENPKKYVVYYRPTGSVPYQAITVTDPSARSYDLSNVLTHATSYDVYLESWNLANQKWTSLSHTLVYYQPPEQPASVTATPAANNSLLVEWSAPQTYQPQYYAVSWSAPTDPADPNSGTVPTVAGSQTSYTTPSLTADVAYEVEVKAVSGVLETAPTTTTATPVVIPNPPSNVTVTHIDLGFAVSWTGPTPTPTSYSVFYRVVGAPSYTELTGQTSPTNITGLTDLADYQVYVASVNSGGTRSLPNPSTYTAYSFPIVGAVPTATPSNGQLALGFTANLTGGTFVEFKIYNENDTILDGSVSGTVTTGDATGSKIITGLTNGVSKTYKISVVTIEDGLTQESAKVAVSGTPFDYPTLTGSVVEGDEALTFNLTATTYGGTIKEYRRYNGSSLAATNTTGASTTSFVFGSGLTNGSTYSYDFEVVVTVGGVDYTSQSRLSLSGNPYGAPIATQEAITSVPKTADTDAGKMTVGASTFNNNGRPITGYKIYLYDSLSQLVSGYPISVSSLSQTLTNIAFGSYTVKVSAVNARGEGPLSNPSSSLQVWTAPTINVTSMVLNGGSGTTVPSVILTWTANLNGVYDISSYNLHALDNAAFVTGTKTNPYTALPANHTVALGGNAWFYIVPRYRLASGGTIYTPLKTDSTTYKTDNILIANVPTKSAGVGIFLKNGNVPYSFYMYKSTNYSYNNNGSAITRYFVRIYDRGTGGSDPVATAPYRDVWEFTNITSINSTTSSSPYFLDVDYENDTFWNTTNYYTAFIFAQNSRGISSSSELYINTGGNSTGSIQVPTQSRLFITVEQTYNTNNTNDIRSIDQSNTMNGIDSNQSYNYKIYYINSDNSLILINTVDTFSGLNYQKITETALKNNSSLIPSYGTRGANYRFKSELNAYFTNTTISITRFRSLKNNFSFLYYNIPSIVIGSNNTTLHSHIQTDSNYYLTSTTGTRKVKVTIYLADSGGPADMTIGVEVRSGASGAYTYKYYPYSSAYTSSSPLTATNATFTLSQITDYSVANKNYTASSTYPQELIYYITLESGTTNTKTMTLYVTNSGIGNNRLSKTIGIANTNNNVTYFT